MDQQLPSQMGEANAGQASEESQRREERAHSKKNLPRSFFVMNGGKK